MKKKIYKIVSLFLLSFFQITCSYVNSDEPSTHKDKIGTNLYNYIKSEVNDTIATSGYSEKFELFDFIPRDSFSIHTLNTKIYCFNQSGLSFIVLFNKKNKYYQIVTSTRCKHSINPDKIANIYSGINETDMKGIENYLDFNYRSIDSSVAFASAIDTLFRAYLSECSGVEYLSHWKRVNNHLLLDSVLNFSENSHNQINKKSLDCNYKLFTSYLHEILNNKLCFIYFDGSFINIFNIYYRGYNTCSADWAFKGDKVRNFKSNYRIDRIQF